MADAALNKYGRAWVEINLDALSLNLADIRSKITKSCEIMAVLKADAYGHGVEKIAERLVSEGIKAFAVATVVEGVELRGYVPEGDILVMGYTHPKDAGLLFNHKLSQLVVDGSHAKALNAAGYRLRVHIAVDTGMHRLGIEPSNIKEVEGVFSNVNLTVEAISTHLASPDTLEKSDTDFTKTQMESFFNLVRVLKEKGYDTGKLHAQSSYGIYNYPELVCDYVRPGIMLYGVLSQEGDTRVEAKLHPMLSLKAVISQVRWIKAGESVSYGRLFTAEKSTKIATVGIGYADGVPRQMTNNGGLCLVNGNKVPIIGRICMDMIMLDVTDAGDVKAGDIATLIGKDGDEVIRCEQVAAAAGTITNDILCRLGMRLPRVYI
jgi:serine/alanine racemase